MAGNTENIDNGVLAHKNHHPESKRFQERLTVGHSGLHARIHQTSYVYPAEFDEEDFGLRVCIRDVSRSGLGLTTSYELELDSTCLIQITGMAPLKGSLIYQRASQDGEFRYGLCLDEWLSEEIHQNLSLFR
ncbi:PilZ domain-containing protein [Enterovibrio sp. ZSDZ35]|uniref:PilZ domain-containing protein n=1 Tax=Enterovibrio qingdaonensis TaxID=2899818 RepID=A0ABT5QJN3_9GAMM|nr:PilZ domain-containing protein [Enterovibrio sp. ZSDZ35]MDD1781207.1 PilZ domain-containing protein [Enterovibrio sp. ZSDZ35]